MTIRIEALRAWVADHEYFLIALGVIAVVVLWMHYKRHKEEKDFERYMNQKR